VHVNGNEDLVLSVDCRAGSVDTPDALQNLVVGQAWRLAAVEVRDTTGAAVAGARVQLSELGEGSTAAVGRNTQRGGGGGRGGQSRTTDTAGRVALPVLSTRSYSVTVNKNDFLRKTVSPAEFPLNVVMEHGLTASIELPADIAQLGERNLRIWLVAKDADTSDFGALFGGATASASISSTDRSVTLRNVAAGDFQIVGMVSAGRPNTAPRTANAGGQGAGGQRPPRTGPAGGRGNFQPVPLGTMHIGATGAATAELNATALASLLSETP
jgi:hypothetical protein